MRRSSHGAVGYMAGMFAAVVVCVFCPAVADETWVQDTAADFDAGLKLDVGTVTIDDGEAILVPDCTYEGRNPVLDLGEADALDDVHAYVSTVMKDGDEYRMWYSGHDGIAWRAPFPALSSNGVTWTKCGTNVLLSLGDPGDFDEAGLLHTHVLKDGSTYKMWYNGLSGGKWRIGYATSPDGLTWTKVAGSGTGGSVLDLGAGGSWEDVNVARPFVIKDGAVYKMWYQGYSGQNTCIGYATSPDGTNWTKYANNPVLSWDAGVAWKAKKVSAGWVVKDGATFKMWYMGEDAGLVGRIGYAESPNGTNWTEYAGNPVLDLGAATAWDDVDVGVPCVLKEGTGYRMWFNGFDQNNWRVGYATSPDGTNWAKLEESPMLGVGEGWESDHVLSGSTLKEGSTYKMWYAGYGGGASGIGYATSTSASTWSRYDSNPVLAGGDPWENGYVYDPCVINDGGTYKMWYAGGGHPNYQIGYAESPDGTNWTKYAGNPVVPTGAGGAFDDTYASQPCVIKDGGTYKMWYAGAETPSYLSIGYATSPDGTNWTKTGRVFDRVGGTWEGTAVQTPWVVKDGSTYRMWYMGYNSVTYAIGYATSPDGTNWTRHPANPVLIPGGTWDDMYVGYPHLLQDGADYVMWYCGHDGGKWQMGIADTALYPSCGTLASQIRDFGDRQVIRRISWSESLPCAGCDVAMEYRTTDDPTYRQCTPETIWPWVAVPDAGGDNSEWITGPVLGRYVQWRATLTSTNAFESPQLQDVTVQHSDPPRGTLVMVR